MNTQSNSEALPLTNCPASLLDAAKILLPELERKASKLRKSRHHNALHDLHIVECAISTLEDISCQNAIGEARAESAAPNHDQTL